MSEAQISLGSVNASPLKVGENVKFIGVLESASWPYFDINYEDVDIFILVYSSSGTPYMEMHTTKTYKSYQVGINYELQWVVPLSLGGISLTGKQITVFAEFQGNADFGKATSPDISFAVEGATDGGGGGGGTSGYSLVLTNSSDPYGWNIESCAPLAGGYVYALKPSGALFGKVDIPKGACRTDFIAMSYFNEAGYYKVRVADYSNVTKVERTIYISTPGGGNGGGGTAPKYYNCVNGKCLEVGYQTQYVNDTTCGGKCIAAPPSDSKDNTALYAGAAVVVIGAGYYLYKKSKQKR